MVSTTPILPPAPLGAGKNRKKKSTQIPGIRPKASPHVQAQIRTMYLVRGMQPREIAAELGIPSVVVQSITRRNGWVKIRSDRWETASKQVEVLMEQEVKRTLKEAAFTSEELMIGAGELARKVLQDNDNKNQCRDLSSSAQAMRTFLEISKSCRGIGENTASQAVDISFFVLPAAPKKEEKNVSPAVLQADEHKQVTNPQKMGFIEIEKT
jgi:hypothetical protein